jgi:[ribosomal protein S5]-alanine N-acetyltransferase
MGTVRSGYAEDPQKRYMFIVTLRESGSLIGSCGLTLDAHSSKGELGYCLNRAFWGMGYMPEAIRAVLGFAFGPLELHRVSAPIHSLNPRSARAAEKCGLRPEGKSRQSHFVKGSWWDIDHFAVLAEEWRSASTV